MFLLNFFSRSSSTKRQIGKDRSLEPGGNSVIPELQTEHLDNIEDDTRKTNNLKKDSQIDIKIPIGDIKHEYTEPSMPLNMNNQGTPNNTSAIEKANYMKQAFSSHDNSAILKETINRHASRRPRGNNAVSADKGQERYLAKHNEIVKPLKPRLPKAEGPVEKYETTTPQTYLRPLKIHAKARALSKEREREKEKKPEVRADQMFVRADNYVKKQNNSIARTLREIGNLVKNPNDTSMHNTSGLPPRKRELHGTPLREKKESSMILEDRFGTPTKDFFREVGSERNSVNTNNPRELPRKSDLYPHGKAKKLSIEKLLSKQQFGIPQRSDVSFRSTMENGPTPPATLAGEENRFVRYARIRSSKPNSSTHYDGLTSQDMNVSQADISTHRMLDDDLIDRIQDRSSRNRQTSIPLDYNDYEKDLEKVDALFHKNEDAFAHLVNIRGKLMDMYLVGGLGGEKTGKKNKLIPHMQKN